MFARQTCTSVLWCVCWIRRACSSSHTLSFSPPKTSLQSLFWLWRPARQVGLTPIETHLWVKGDEDARKKRRDARRTETRGGNLVDKVDWRALRHNKCVCAHMYGRLLRVQYVRRRMERDEDKMANEQVEKRIREKRRRGETRSVSAVLSYIRRTS